MAKLKYKLDTRRALSDGKFPLKISLSHNSNTVLISTGYNYSEKEWKSVQPLLESNRRKPRIENIICEQKSNLDLALKLIVSERDISRINARELCDIIIAKANSGFQEAEDDGAKTRFLPYYQKQQDSKDTKGTWMVYEVTKRMIRKFEEQEGRNPDKLTFEDIDKTWLKEFEKWMSVTNGPSSINKNMRNIRCVINAAIEDGLTHEYPFKRSRKERSGRKYQIPQPAKARDRNVPVEKLREFRDYPCVPFQEKYRDLFMLMVYLIGINAADLFQATPDQLKNGRLYYIRQKTHKPYSIKVEPEAMSIIEKYRGTRLLLEPCEHYKDYSYFLHHMNDALKSIGYTYKTRQKRTGEALLPDLTTYWARNTWGNLGVEIDLSKDKLGLGYGHAWAQSTVTDRYLSIDEHIVDAANRKVLDYIAGLIEPEDYYTEREKYIKAKEMREEVVRQIQELVN